MIPRPKRILFMDHTAVLGGGEIALLNLVRHLDVKRYRPLVLLFGDGPLRKRLEDADVETHVIELDPRVSQVRKGTLGLGSLLRLRDVASSISFVWRVACFIRDSKADLVHTNSLKSDILGGLAARIARRPLIWHVRDRIAEDYLPRRVTIVFRRLCRIIPNVLIANSSATLRTLASPDRDLDEVVYSGIEFDSRTRVVHDGTRSLARDHHAGNDSLPPAANCVPLVGLVGRISPWKGQHVFVRAAAVVHERFPDARFQIIGSAMFSEEAYEAEVRRLVKGLGLDGHVEFLGFRDDVSRLIDRMDVLVHASTTGEPFGQVVVEGMAAAKPVVATNGGGVAEIVVDGKTGILVPMGDAEAMAVAISRLLEDEPLAKRMGAAGQDRVEERFTIQRTALEVERIYDHLLAPV